MKTHTTHTPRGADGAASSVPPSGVAPAEALAAEWVVWLRGAGFRRASTADAYRGSLRDFLRVSGATDFRDVRTRDLDEYVNLLMVRGVSKGTIRTRLFAIRSFFEWAVAREHLERNPAATGLFRIPPDDRTARPVFVLEVAEIERLLAVRQPPPVRGKREPEVFFQKRSAQVAGQDERDRALLLVAYTGALRVSEIAALRWADVATDARNGTLRIGLRSSKRSDYPATIHLDEVASRALLSWKNARAAAGKAGPLIFGMSAKACSDAFERVARLAGIPSKHGRRPTFHVLRASRATHAAESGMTDREVAALLRHRNLESVTRYIRAATETRKRILAVSSLPWNARKIRVVRVPRGSAA